MRPGPGVWLGVDVGSVRIGVARSDRDHLLATPLTTVQRGPSDLRELAALVVEHDATVVVVGLPLSLSGAEGRAAAEARVFAGSLATAVAPTPVRLVDERFTTSTAHGQLREAGRSARASRTVVDQQAAVIMLQYALDATRAGSAAVGEPVRPSHEDEGPGTGEGVG